MATCQSPDVLRPALGWQVAPAAARCIMSTYAMTTLLLSPYLPLVTGPFAAAVHAPAGLAGSGVDAVGLPLSAAGCRDSCSRSRARSASRAASSALAARRSECTLASSPRAAADSLCVCASAARRLPTSAARWSARSRKCLVLGCTQQESALWAGNLQMHSRCFTRAKRYLGNAWGYRLRMLLDRHRRVGHA